MVPYLVNSPSSVFGVSWENSFLYVDIKYGLRAYLEFYLALAPAKLLIASIYIVALYRANLLHFPRMPKRGVATTGYRKKQGKPTKQYQLDLGPPTIIRHHRRSFQPHLIAMCNKRWAYVEELLATKSHDITGQALHSITSVQIKRININD